MPEKLKKDEEIMIHFKSDDWPCGYALCVYSGKSDEKHVFTSITYGWKYIVDLLAGTVINEKQPEKVYQLDNATGWVKYLP